MVTLATNYWDLFPWSAMHKMPFKPQSRIALMALALGWSTCAPWLSANKLISVWTELTSYLTCLIVVICGAVLYIVSRNASKTWARIDTRSVVALSAFLAVVALSLSSNRAFFFWKSRAVPVDAWSQMILDLERVARLSAETGTNYLSSAVPPPMSLRQLGLGNDYAGGSGHLVNSPEYTGVAADIEFGNKVRVWGLHVGSEMSLNEFCPDCRHRRVGPNAFFYVGSRG